MGACSSKNIQLIKITTGNIIDLVELAKNDIDKYHKKITNMFSNLIDYDKESQAKLMSIFNPIDIENDEQAFLDAPKKYLDSLER